MASRTTPVPTSRTHLIRDWNRYARQIQGPTLDAAAEAAGGEQTASGWTPSEIMADRAAIRRGDIERSRGVKSRASAPSPLPYTEGEFRALTGREGRSQQITGGKAG